MDRREALKKLAAGTALTIASPLIVKTTAFADSGTVTCLPTPFTITQLSAIAGQIGVTDVAGYVQVIVRDDTPVFLNSIGCPGVYIRSNQYRWGISNTSPASVVLNAAGTANITNLWRPQNRVRIVTSLAGGTLSNSGTYEVTAQFRVACSNGTRVCWRCGTFTVGFTWDSATTTVSAVSLAAAVGSANCDTTPPVA